MSDAAAPEPVAPLAADVAPPVLIFASRESGGSLLAALLGAQPGFAPAPSLNVLAFDHLWHLLKYAAIPRDSHLHGLWRFIAHHLTGEQSVAAVQAAHRWLARRSKATAPQIYADLCALVAPCRLVDYSPLIAQDRAAMARALALAPQAFVIHLTRHPFAQAQALRQPVWDSVRLSLDFWDRRGVYQPPMDVFELGEQYVDWSTTPPVFDPQFAWARTQTAARDLLATRPPESWMHVTAESLALAPGPTLAAILDRLGRTARPEDLTALTALTTLASVPPFAMPGPYNAPFGMDAAMLSRTLADALADLRTAPVSQPGPRKGRPAGLPWRGDGDRFVKPVAALARSFGYALAR